jgi:hypothetical protein
MSDGVELQLSRMTLAAGPNVNLVINLKTAKP